MAYNNQQPGMNMQQGAPPGQQNVHQNNGQQQGIGMQQQGVLSVQQNVHPNNGIGMQQQGVLGQQLVGQNNNGQYPGGIVLQYQGNGLHPQQGLLQGQHNVLPTNGQYQGGIGQYQGGMQGLPQGQQNGQINNGQQLGGIAQYQSGQGLPQGLHNGQNNNLQNQGGMQQGVVAPGQNVQHINGQYTQQGLLQGPQNGQYTVQPYGMSMQPVPQNVRQNNNGQQSGIAGILSSYGNNTNNTNDADSSTPEALQQIIGKFHKHTTFIYKLVEHYDDNKNNGTNVDFPADAVNGTKKEFEHLETWMGEGDEAAKAAKIAEFFSNRNDAKLEALIKVVPAVNSQIDPHNPDEDLVGIGRSATNLILRVLNDETVVTDARIKSDRAVAVIEGSRHIDYGTLVFQDDRLIDHMAVFVSTSSLIVPTQGNNATQLIRSLKIKNTIIVGMRFDQRLIFSAEFIVGLACLHKKFFNNSRLKDSNLDGEIPRNYSTATFHVLQIQHSLSELSTPWPTP